MDRRKENTLTEYGVQVGTGNGTHQHTPSQYPKPWAVIYIIYARKGLFPCSFDLRGILFQILSPLLEKVNSGWLILNLRTWELHVVDLKCV